MLVFYRISGHPSSPLMVTHSLRVAENLSWNLSVHGFQINSYKCGLLSDVPEILNHISLEKLLKLIDSCNVCPGNPDRCYIEMIEAKKGRLMSKNGQDISAAIDSFSPVHHSDKQYSKTVRVSSCELLVKGNKCASCVSYSDSLRKMTYQSQ